MKIVKETLYEYLAGERQEGGRFKTPGQVDPPMVEEDNEKKYVKADNDNQEVTIIEEDDEVEEVEEDMNPAAMPGGNYIIQHPNKFKKQL